MRITDEQALENYTAKGHQGEDDSPGVFSSVFRFTCKRCGCAMLCSRGNWYGSALEITCDEQYAKNEAYLTERNRKWERERELAERQQAERTARELQTQHKLRYPWQHPGNMFEVDWG